jgi:hypothetical protein
MTEQSRTDDLLAALERDVRRVIEDNKRFLARVLEDDADFAAEELTDGE